MGRKSRYAVYATGIGKAAFPCKGMPISNSVKSGSIKDKLKAMKEKAAIENSGKEAK